MPDVLTAAEEQAVLRELAAEPGHFVHQIHPAHEFGWRFASAVRGPGSALTVEDYLGPMPSALTALWLLCVERAHLPAPMKTVDVPDHALVNVYAPGDSCLPHVDDLSFWQDWVVGVSLGSGATLEMRPNAGAPCPHCLGGVIAVRNPRARKCAHCRDGPVHRLWLPPRSIYVLTGDARSKWTHAITGAHSDVVDGKRVARSTRTSVTFRTISASALPAWLREASALTKSIP